MKGEDGLECLLVWRYIKKSKMYVALRSLKSKYFSELPVHLSPLKPILYLLSPKFKDIFQLLNSEKICYFNIFDTYQNIKAAKG